MIDPDFNKTFTSSAGGATHGYYDPGKSWEVYLNANEIRALGIYDEISAHEHMHHQLTCSTAFGHATQLAARIADKRQVFKPIQQTFMDLTWSAHEGAAMLAGFDLHSKTSLIAHELQALLETENYDGNNALRLQAKLEGQYLSNYHKKYEAPFSLFRYLRNTALHPHQHAGASSIFANAIGQFALNTDVLLLFNAYLNGEKVFTAEYFNATNNNPGKRLHTLAKAVQADAESACSCLRALFMEKMPLLSAAGISLDEYGAVDFDNEDRTNILFFSDWMNNAFLEWACRVSGLTVAAFHAREIARQFDDLLKKHQKFVRTLDLPTKRFDISVHPDRWDFKPFVRDIG